MPGILKDALKAEIWFYRQAELPEIVQKQGAIAGIYLDRQSMHPTRESGICAAILLLEAAGVPEEALSELREAIDKMGVLV